MKQIKIAIFDLDDTLYEGNSHFMILNEYYHTSLFTSVFMRMVGKVSNRIRIIISNWFYKMIPYDYKRNYDIPFRQDVVGLLNEKKRRGYRIIIISSAPRELIERAAELLNVQYIKAKPYYKQVCLSKIDDVGKLFVCTDNKSDCKLIEMADEAVITCRPKDRDYFRKTLKRKNYVFL